MSRNLTESELLNQPSFDELQAGWEIAFNSVRSGKIRCAETAAGLFPFAREPLLLCANSC